MALLLCECESPDEWGGGLLVVGAGLLVDERIAVVCSPHRKWLGIQVHDLYDLYSTAIHNVTMFW